MNSQRSPRIVVVGSLNMDLVVRTDIAPKEGESVIGNSFSMYLGGKGANQAVAVARLGGQIIMAGKVGEDPFGESMLKSLDDEGIDTRYIIRDSGYETGIAFITLESSGQNRIIAVPGANFGFNTSELNPIYEIINESDLLLMQLEMKLDVIETTVNYAYSRGIPVILNPGPVPAHPLSDELLRKITCITPNESEAEALTGIPVHSIEDAITAAKVLIAKGIQKVAVTLGEQGVVIAEGEQSVHISPFRVHAVDTVAAGDTFTGALAVELIKKRGFLDAATFACAAAAISVTREGAMPSIPSRREVEDFIRQILIE